MIRLGETEYEVIPLSSQREELWQSYCLNLAKTMDHPAKRFIEKHCDGLPADDQQRLLTAWMSRDNWDAPPERILKYAKESRLSAAVLAMYCLTPEITWEQADSLVTEDNKREIWRAISRISNPSNDDILAQNAELRKRIEERRTAQQALPEIAEHDGGE